MRNFQQKRGWRNIAESWPVLALLGALVLFFSYEIIGFVGKMEVTRSNRERAEYKVAELKKEKEKLSSDIAKLKTEQGIEESIREKFGLAREGEGLIIVVEDRKQTVPETAAPSGFFSWLGSWFGNLFR